MLEDSAVDDVQIEKALQQVNLSYLSERFGHAFRAQKRWPLEVWTGPSTSTAASVAASGRGWASRAWRCESRGLPLPRLVEL